MLPEPSTPAAHDSYQPGQILAERYRVISLLGQGGMGLVYRVEQIFLRKELALKTIYKHLISDVSVRRFQAEAKAASAVHHPNIVTLHDFGLLEDHTPYLVMEMLAGETLGDLLKTRTLTVEETLPLFIQICFALAHAHEKHVVHRDIKPNNLMLLNTMDETVSIKILDFGIAKLAQDDEGEIQALTRTGEIFGSPLYMSPEQCRGLKVDNRSDVYSLGCVLFEALTGTTPFVGETAMTTMMLHSTAEVPSLKEASLGKEFPPALENIVRTMLAKDPDHRYQNLGRAAMDLAALQRGESKHVTKAVKPTATTSNTIAITRTQLTSIILAVFAIAALAGAATMNMLHAQRRSSGDTLPASHFSDQDDSKQQKSAGQKNSSIKTDEKNPFASSMANNENRIERNLEATDANLEYLKNYTSLQHLTVNYNPGITDRGLLALKDLKLVHLAVIGCENIKTGEAFDKLPYLQTIYAGNTGITDDALPHLAKLKMLTKLHLKKCKLTSKGLEQLSSSSSLREIFLSPEDYKHSEIIDLSKKFRLCTFPGIINTPQFTAQERAQCIDAGVAQKPPYKIPVKVAALPLQMQSEILNGIALKFAEKHNLKEALALHHRASMLAEQSGDQRWLARSLTLEAETLVSLDDTVTAIPLLQRAFQLSVDCVDHSTAEFFDFLYRLTVIPARTGDHIFVNKICQTAIGYLNALRPEDHANITRFTKLQSN